jgi:DNA helicase-2/ATP-dependent DNA helicase PcrA
MTTFDLDDSQRAAVTAAASGVHFRIDGRWVVVDWKTGAKPTEAEKDAKAMQLVLYRRALAALLSIDVTEVDAVLYYIAHDWEWTVEPERLARLDALPPID